MGFSIPLRSAALSGFPSISLINPFQGKLRLPATGEPINTGSLNIIFIYLVLLSSNEGRVPQLPSLSLHALVEKHRVLAALTGPADCLPLQACTQVGTLISQAPMKLFKL